MHRFSHQLQIWITGFAMFSMFFGAGNVVFPLSIGQYAQDQNIYAILGLLITAVGVPFLGLFGIILYEGDYPAFFASIGKIPGFLLSLTILSLIGPFAAIPRCIVLCFATAKLYLPAISLESFSFFSCLLIFILTYKKNNLLDLLGAILTPILLMSLLFMIIAGFYLAPETPESTFKPLDAFLMGLNEGYQTLDLISAFFFSSMVISTLKKKQADQKANNPSLVISDTLKASLIGAFLLSLIYIGFSFVAASYSVSLSPASKDELPALLALTILGPLTGGVAVVAVGAACLTTAMALTAVFADFIEKILQYIHPIIEKSPQLNSFAFNLNHSYLVALLMTLITSFIVSTFGFNGIAQFLTPVLQVCYPTLIVLTCLNILNRLYGRVWIKLPCLLVLILSLIFQFVL